MQDTNLNEELDDDFDDIDQGDEGDHDMGDKAVEIVRSIGTKKLRIF